MRYFDPGFSSAISSARGAGIQPAFFVWFTGKDRDSGAPVSMGVWSRARSTSISVPLPDGSNSALRTYIGGCGLSVSGLRNVADLTDNPVTVTMSQIADAAQYLIRGLDLRLARCEIHATSLRGSVLVSAPQLQWVGIVDEGPISTPAAGSDGGISLSVRSEILSMLSAINPAKSSDAHQKRRREGDEFSKYSSTVSARNIQWYQGDS